MINCLLPAITWKVNSDLYRLANRLENKVLVVGFLLLTILERELQDKPRAEIATLKGEIKRKRDSCKS